MRGFVAARLQQQAHVVSDAAGFDNAHAQPFGHLVDMQALEHRPCALAEDHRCDIQQQLIDQARG